PSHLSPSLFPPLPRPTLFPYTTLFRSLDRDCPAGIRCTHCARRQNHEIAVLSHQYDIVSPMILDYEVDGPQHLRQQGGCLRLDPDRKSTRLNSSHVSISYAVFCLKKKN